MTRIEDERGSITSFDSELVAKVIRMSIELFRQQERFTPYRFSFFLFIYFVKKFNQDSLHE